MGLIAEQRSASQKPSIVEASSRRVAGFFLIILMAIGSIAMWLVVPVGLVYLASQLQDSSQPSLGPYLVVIFGLPIGMVVIGKLLESWTATTTRSRAPSARCASKCRG